MIGVLALQGDFEAHWPRSRRAGVPRASPCARRRRSGPSTASSSRAASPRRSGSSWRGRASRRRSARSPRRGDAVLGTCAGAILLARRRDESRGPRPRPPSRCASSGTPTAGSSTRRSLRLTDVDRGALGAEPLEAVFIRAPRITSVGPGRRGPRAPRRRSRPRPEGQRRRRDVPSGARRTIGRVLDVFLGGAREKIRAMSAARPRRHDRPPDRRLRRGPRRDPHPLALPRQGERPLDGVRRRRSTARRSPPRRTTPCAASS